MKKFIVLTALVVALLVPSSALAHHVDTTASKGKTNCLVVTVVLVGFNSYDKQNGIDIDVDIDGKRAVDKYVAPNEFSGSNKTIEIPLPKFTDNKSHHITVGVKWKTGSGWFSKTVSNCCPPPPICCVDGQPGPPGPAGPAGPAGPPGEDGTDGQNTSSTERVVVERLTERVVEVRPATCYSKRVYVFLVKRWHRIERPGEPARRILVRSLRDLKVSEKGFKVTKKIVRRNGHRRFQVTVTPPAGGKKAVPGQVNNTTISVRLKGRKGWVSLGERRRLCRPANGNINAPSASGNASG